MSKNDRYVVRHGGDWQAAKETVRKLGGGEVRIQGEERGRWRDSDTVPPGNDPFPPRDRKHSDLARELNQIYWRPSI